MREHITYKKSAKYGYRNDKPKIRLVVNAPSRDKKCLIKVENEYIQEYSKKYRDRLLNTCGTKQTAVKVVKFKVVMESETALRERIQKLGKTLRIKDDAKLLYYDGIVDGKRYKTISRYNKCSKEEDRKSVV